MKASSHVLSQVIFMAERIEVIRFRDLSEVRWRNGTGRTVTLVQSPLDAPIDEVDWRLSIATIDSEATFSDFIGYDRWLMSIGPAGLTLRIDGEPCELAPFESVRFRGDDPVTSRPHGTGERDLNLMVRSGSVHADLRLSMLRPEEHLLLRGGDAQVEIGILVSGTASAASPNGSERVREVIELNDAIVARNDDVGLDAGHTGAVVVVAQLRQAHVDR